MGEQHACERQCMDALAGPQRSMDSGASRPEQPAQTKNHFANTSCSVSKASESVLAETHPIFFANRTLSTARI
jgi:hypothetical protein